MCLFSFQEDVLKQTNTKNNFVVQCIIDLFSKFFTLSSTIAISCKFRYILMFIVYICHAITLIFSTSGHKLQMLHFSNICIR